MAFGPEDQTSRIRVAPPPQIDPLLEFSSEEIPTAVVADRHHESASPASGAWRAFRSEVTRDVTRCGTWLSARQAGLKIGLYEMAGGVYETAGSLPIAVRVRSRAIDRRLRLWLSFAPATLNAIVMRGSAFRPEVVRAGRQCLTWLSTSQADLKNGLYKMAAGLYEAAAHVPSHSIDRHLKLALRSARATLNAIAMRVSGFTSGYRSHNPRAFIQFGCGVAVGVVVTLFLPVQSIPGATMPTPGPALAQRASRAPDVTLALSVRPPTHAASVAAGVEQMVTTAGRREPNQISVVPSRPQPPSPRNTSSTQRAASPKLAGYRGSLVVNSAPTGATVLVNGVPVGTTPLLLKDVPVGSRVVRLELDGYRRWSSAVRVVANQRVRTAVDLQPSPSNN